MGKIELPPKALLFAGLLYNENINRDILFGILQREFGSIILRSEPFPFSETDYYAEEMGSELWREWVGFNTLIDQDRIVEVKLKSNELEKEFFSTGGKRIVNIDTGFITHGKVVLATTKNHQHRIYLRDGIYAEVTLRYRSKSFMPWEWTYPDYRRIEAITFFNELRKLYRKKLVVDNQQNLY